MLRFPSILDHGIHHPGPVSQNALVFHLTSVAFKGSVTDRCTATCASSVPLWHSAPFTMATAMAPVAARDVLRCDHCALVQFRTINALCRRCHKPLEVEE